MLLDALEPNADFEAFAAAWRRSRRAASQPRAPELSGLVAAARGRASWRAISARNAALAFRAARRFGHRSAFAAQSFWWTIGGEGFSPMALSSSGMPAATRFADLLTGAFETGAAEGGAWRLISPFAPQR